MNENDLAFVAMVGVSCCFVRRHLTRIQNYFESTVKNFLGDEFAAQKSRCRANGTACFRSDRLQRKTLSSSEGCPSVSENFFWYRAYHLHFNRVEPETLAKWKAPLENGKRVDPGNQVAPEHTRFVKHNIKKRKNLVNPLTLPE